MSVAVPGVRARVQSRSLPGGLIYERGGWFVEHCVGPLGVGTLIVKPRRHATRVSDLDTEGAAAPGPMLVRAAPS